MSESAAIMSKDLDDPWECNQCPVLLVDDSVFNIQALELNLKKLFNFDVDTAFDGKQAVNAFKDKIDFKESTCLQTQCSKHIYHLIFMDLNMPVLDGFDATKQILDLQKNLPQEKRAKIVAVTAYVDAANINRCMDIGMVEVINKPATPDELLNTITKNCPDLL